MRQIKLTKNEKEIENALVQGGYVDIDRTEFKKINRSVSLKKHFRVIASPEGAKQSSHYVA